MDGGKWAVKTYILQGSKVISEEIFEIPEEEREFAEDQFRKAVHYTWGFRCA